MRTTCLETSSLRTRTRTEGLDRIGSAQNRHFQPPSFPTPLARSLARSPPFARPSRSAHSRNSSWQFLDTSAPPTESYPCFAFASLPYYLLSWGDPAECRLLLTYHPVSARCAAEVDERAYIYLSSRSDRIRNPCNHLPVPCRKDLSPTPTVPRRKDLSPTPIVCAESGPE